MTESNNRVKTGHADQFDLASAPEKDPLPLYVIAFNHSFSHLERSGELLIPDRMRAMSSGMSQEAFEATMLDFVKRHNRGIIGFGDGYFIMTADEGTMDAIKTECGGSRFCYQQVDGDGLEQFAESLQSILENRSQRAQDIDFANESLTRYDPCADRPFIIISNHRYPVAQPLDPDYRDVQEFMAQVLAFAALNCVRVSLCKPEYAIITGGEEVMELAERELGPCFGYNLASRAEAGQLLMLDEGVSARSIMELQESMRDKLEVASLTDVQMLPNPHFDA